VTLRASAVALLAMMGACAPQPGPAPASPAAADAVVGTVRVVGSAPMNTQVVVRGDAGGEVRVDGPLAAEVRRLAGARVSVRGRVAEGRVQAEGYEVVSVDGRPVQMGVVERAPDGGTLLRRADGSVIRLRGPAAADFRPGQKVWVQGVEAVDVQTFGVVVP
jgi:hypothetical protein